MKSHWKARLAFLGRMCLVQGIVREGWTARVTARAPDVSDREVCEWLPIIIHYERDLPGEVHIDPKKIARMVE
ncbi:MAG: hypothetical protein JJD97_08250 [Gemmatimonadaceae bacterium]|nr:hypothetical protein [Gemmatimonadaceae bacterium]